MNGSRLTIELDEATASTLRDLTELWGVPAQEAVVRAVMVAAGTVVPRDGGGDRVAVFRQLQRAAAMTPEKASQWKDSARTGRR